MNSLSFSNRCRQVLLILAAILFTTGFAHAKEFRVFNGNATPIWVALFDQGGYSPSRAVGPSGSSKLAVIEDEVYPYYISTSDREIRHEI